MEAEQKIDMNRHEEIDGLKAIKLFLEGEELLSEEGQKYRIDPTFNQLYYVPWAHEALSNLSFNEIASRNWYIKKPFDVRAEMLARPNEWVGAFKNDTEDWIRVGFDSNAMSVVITLYSKHKVEPDARYCTVANSSVLEKCTPIEDVPKEELS